MTATKPEISDVRIRIKPSTRLRLKRAVDLLAKKRKVIACNYDDAILELLENAK